MSKSAIEVAKDLFDQSPTWSQNKVAARMGLSSQAMSNRMQAKDIKVGFFAEVLDVLGYDLVVVPQSCTRLPNGSMVVGGAAESAE